MSECPRCKQLARQVGQLAGHNIEYHAEIERLTDLHALNLGWEIRARKAEALNAEMLATLNRIADMCPATAEITLAHEMADNAMAAIAKVEGKVGPPKDWKPDSWHNVDGEAE